MSFVAIAVGGAAVVGAGASIYGGMQQAEAAKGGAAAQTDALATANRTTIEGGREALAYLDPFRATGLRAGTSLEDALYSPEQRASQNAAQRIQLQGEIDRLMTQIPKWDTYQMLTGPKASERRATMFTTEYNAARQKVAEAQAKLKTFDAQVAAQPAGGTRPSIEASPWYQFQAELLGRNMDRAFAARGLTGSGFEAEERRRGLIELGAGETERQFGRLKGLYDVGANLATAGAGAITGTSQAVANNQIAAGRAEAEGLYGVAGANRDMAYGISNSITGAAGTYLEQNQWDKFRADLNNRNNPTTPLTEAQQRSSLSAYNPANSSNFGPWPQ